MALTSLVRLVVVARTMCAVLVCLQLLPCENAFAQVQLYNFLQDPIIVAAAIVYTSAMQRASVTLVSSSLVLIQPIR